jgi:agmatine deiminase
MYHRPAEWHHDKTIWLAWPWDNSLWGEDLGPAQDEFLALVLALTKEQLVILFRNQADLDHASTRFNKRPGLSLIVCAYADIWLRDTLPIALKDQAGQTAAIIPTFNGWGNKYLFAADHDLSSRVAHLWSVPTIRSSVIFEGGAIECDGQGTLLTTEQCLLNKNRNPHLDKQAIEQEFLRLFGAQKVIWLKEGLKNDHTDGHVDTIARFIAPNKIAVMVPKENHDPNYDVLMAIKNQLAAETDAMGRRFELLEVPSPAAVKNRDGKLMPASFLNFIMGDHTLVTPTYGTIYDDEAVSIFKQAVTLSVIGLSAKAILTGGGGFHCVSQEFFR